MICHKRIHLECLDVLKNYLIDQVEKTLPNHTSLPHTITKRIDLPADLVDILNTEFRSYSAPEIEYCRIYLRKKNDTQDAHIDGDKEVLHCAINIPLRGGEGSVFRWLGGQYELKRVDVIGSKQVRYDIVWTTGPEIIDSVEMLDGCYLVRIDQPHQAISSIDSDRWVFTIRFKGNPTFEDLEKLFK